nr:MAG TPA: hypothetical protein [Caudoviricetes sp.]
MEVIKDILLPLKVFKIIFVTENLSVWRLRLLLKANTLLAMVAVKKFYYQIY